MIPATLVRFVVYTILITGGLLAAALPFVSEMSDLTAQLVGTGCGIAGPVGGIVAEGIRCRRQARRELDGARVRTVQGFDEAATASTQRIADLESADRRARQDAR